MGEQEVITDVIHRPEISEDPDTGLVGSVETVSSAREMEELASFYANSGYLCFPLNRVTPEGEYVPGKFFAIPLERLPGGPCFSATGDFADIQPGQIEPPAGILRAMAINEASERIRELTERLREQYLIHDEREWGNLYYRGYGGYIQKAIEKIRKDLRRLNEKDDRHPTPVSFPSQIQGELTDLELVRLGIMTQVYKEFGYVGSDEIDPVVGLHLDYYTKNSLQTPLLFGRFDGPSVPDNPYGFRPTATLRLIYPGDYYHIADAIREGSPVQEKPFKTLYPGMVPAYTHVEIGAIGSFLSIPTFAEASQAATHRSKGRVLGQMVNMLQCVFTFLNSDDAIPIFEALPSNVINGKEAPALAMAIAGQRDVAKGVESFFRSVSTARPSALNARHMALSLRYPKLITTCRIGRPSYELRGEDIAINTRYGQVYPLQIIIQRRV